jgi:hypothetical protein
MALSYDDPPQSWAQSNWTEGTGGVSGFSANGSTDENTRLYDLDPWDRRAIVWRCTPNGLAGDGDGGWNSSLISVDNTKRYRFSVWIRRTVTGSDGRYYFGTRNYNSSDSLIDLEYVNGSNASNNPYFYYGDGENAGDLPQQTWVLMVAHVWPEGTDFASSSTRHPDTGWYGVDGTDYSSYPEVIRDFQWTADTAKAVHRAYLFYGYSTTDAVQDFIYPRVDLCDGTEPGIKALLRHGRSFLLSNILLT